MLELHEDPNQWSRLSPQSWSRLSSWLLFHDYHHEYPIMIIIMIGYTGICMSATARQRNIVKSNHFLALVDTQWSCAENEQRSGVVCKSTHSAFTTPPWAAAAIVSSVLANLATALDLDYLFQWHSTGSGKLPLLYCAMPYTLITFYDHGHTP